MFSYVSVPLVRALKPKLLSGELPILFSDGSCLPAVNAFVSLFKSEQQSTPLLFFGFANDFIELNCLAKFFDEIGQVQLDEFIVYRCFLWNTPHAKFGYLNELRFASSNERFSFLSGIPKHPGDGSIGSCFRTGHSLAELLGKHAIRVIAFGETSFVSKVYCFSRMQPKTSCRKKVVRECFVYTNR